MPETPVPPDVPLMKAWERYKASESYANSFRWAADEKHRTGSLWAAFSAGFAARFLQVAAPATPGSDKCDPADPCSTAHDPASERDTLDGLLSEAKGRLAAAQAEIARLREAHLDATAHLVGAASAYRKHACRSRLVGRGQADPFFTTRIGDFDAAAARARAALAETAATPAPAPAPADDGWTAWEGGKCPVGPLVRVDVRFDDGTSLELSLIHI
jgi:hypothetical protein